MDNTNNGKKNLLQFIKFGLVGASNTAVDMIVQIVLGFIILKFTKESWGVTYAVKGVGYACGILNSYILNTRWTFKQEHTKSGREKFGFVLVNLIVFALSLILTKLLFANAFKLDAWWNGLALPEWLHKLVSGQRFCSLLATVICIPLNFILNKLFVFKGANEKNEA
jgi:putative flippase GtrA